jgi:hypothetical protein
VGNQTRNSRAAHATLPYVKRGCQKWRRRVPGFEVALDISGVVKKRDRMAHLLDRDMAVRMERAVLLSAIGGGFVVCAVVALLYDLSIWFGIR